LGGVQKSGIFAWFSGVFRNAENRTAFLARRKNILLLRSYYVIWKKRGDFVNLFGMTKLVAGD